MYCLNLCCHFIKHTYRDQRSFINQKFKSWNHQCQSKWHYIVRQIPIQYLLLSFYHILSPPSNALNKVGTNYSNQSQVKLLGRSFMCLASCFNNNIRATSHTRLKAYEHYILISIIGRKGRDCPSSLHTRRWRSKGPKKLSWMKSLHGILEIMSRGMLKLAPGPPPRDRHDTNYGGPSRPLAIHYHGPWLMYAVGLSYRNTI